MKLNTTPTLIALAAIALCSALPAAAQTTTIQAEGMARSNYAVEGSLIRVVSYNSPGTATQTFNGASGTYNIQVFVQLENDGQPTLELYRGTTLLRRYVYPLGTSLTSFTVSNVALSAGQQLRLVGRAHAGAVARVDRMVLTQVAAATPPTTTTTTTITPTTTTSTTTTSTTTTPTTSTATATSVTMQAEGMARSNYALEGSLIRLTSTTATGTATQNFSGASGTYNVQVYVQLENDGQPTLELYKGSTLLRRYTYPLGTTLTNFAISNVALAKGETIRLVGRGNGGAVARVDKIVFNPVAVTTPVVTTPPPVTTEPVVTTPPPPTQGLTLPSTNTKAVATFESLGLYWTPPSNPGAAGCNVQYRKTGESAWQNGLAMWYDSRNSECRGSLVHLTPGTAYEVQFSLPGQQPSRQLAATTWSEQFPIARTVTLQSGSQQVNITEGGSPNGYVLYTGPAGTTLDVANGQVHNITISAPYVIVRGLTLKGAQQDAIRLQQGAHDVIIEDNDISGWGRFRGTTADGLQVGMNMEAAVRARKLTGLERVVVQRNRIHHPRYGANSWAYGHPEGAQGIGFEESAGGNHVFRHNEIYSSEGKYFNDGIGEGSNFSAVGFPHADSDIYGNLISHCWDDAIEAEGGNRNVRIWGNYMDRTMVGIATTATHVGPVYIFRNVLNRSRYSSLVSTDADQAGPFGKSGTSTTFGNGRRYVFHNTTLQATAPGATLSLGAAHGLVGPGVPMTNTVSRNNIWHIKRSGNSAISEQGGSGNDYDYDLFNGGLKTYAGAQLHGQVGTPIYQAGHGWSSEANGYYQLAPNSPGYDRGARLPNFNDSFTGAAPDMGAAEAGRPPMRFGLGGGTPASTTTTATAPSITATVSAVLGTGDGTTAATGVCATALCALQ
jgi:hypothetical protein